ncbi:hypothetical protein MTX20_01670 [Bradyrhizobium sp. ISRA435]|nr:hypothetical protein MTX20_01670 [Bradyrhizobium sp. ISRA435]
MDRDRKLEVLIAALNNRRAKPIRKLSKSRIKAKQINASTHLPSQGGAVRRAASI